MNLIPGLKLRASEEAEVLGMDDAEIGEFAYDYVELTRDVINGDALVAGEEDDEEASLSAPGASRGLGFDRGGSRGGDESDMGGKYASSAGEEGSATVHESVGVVGEKGAFSDDDRVLRGYGRR